MKYILKSLSGRSIKLFLGNGECPIFMYHRVVSEDNDDILDKSLIVTKEAFENNIIFLKKYFKIISLKELLEIPKCIEKTCVITFDDGWLDTYKIAFPMLCRYKVPATVFISTDMVGTNKSFWFERLGNLINHITRESNGISAAKEFLGRIFGSMVLDMVNTNTKEQLYNDLAQELKRFLTQEIEVLLGRAEQELSIGGNNAYNKRILINWDEIREMSNAGISFGSHCVNHNILTNLTYKEKMFEITESRRILMEKGINYVDSISFPNGNYDQETLDIAGSAGYKILLTASINRCGEGQSPLLAHRIGVSNVCSKDNNLLAYSILKAKAKRKLYHQKLL